MSAEVELVVDAKAVLGEGPAWTPGPRRRLYWVDIEGRLLHVFDPSTGQDRAIDVGARIGTVVSRAGGGVLVALESGLAFFDLEKEALTPIVDPEARPPRQPLQ